MRAALLQITSSDDPAENTTLLQGLIREAAENGTGFVLTPEVSNCVSQSRSRQNSVLTREADDRMLAMVQEEAARLRVCISLGSIAVKIADPDGRFANRSLLIGPDGDIAARYDKAHMFDVTVSETESYRESAGYRPGDRLAITETPFGTIGLSVCYDIRFPYLYRALAKAGATVLTAPAAFTKVTGEAHWHILQRARAIENGAFVITAAQGGMHENGRATYGHSLIVAPWGEILAEAGTEPEVILAEIDMAKVDEARGRVPSLTHDRSFQPPVAAQERRAS